MDTVITMPRSRPLTRADLDEAPDDGHRYELIDGVLIVTPAPSWHHQRAVVRLLRLLDTACPSSMETLVAPFDVALADDTVMQPDLLVARRSELTMRDLPVAPVLAVEVLSPSTRRIDLTLKRSRYESAGCLAYWVVDPMQPSITTWLLAEGAYVEASHAEGDQELVVTSPLTLTVIPSSLVNE